MAENNLWRTLLQSNRRIQMNERTTDIIISMLRIENIEQFISRTTESQAKNISKAVKNAARALPDTSRAPSININVTIPEAAATNAEQRQLIIQAAISEAAELDNARLAAARTASMSTVP
jgi:hypothetical protein